jgi:hypothetical protein
MSIPIIDMDNGDITELAKQVNDACSVFCLLEFADGDLGVYVLKEPRNSLLVRRTGIRNRNPPTRESY